MRKNKIFITVLSVLALLFTQAAAVIPSSALARGYQEQPIESPNDITSTNSNPLASDGITDAEWQEILEQIQSDEPSTYLKASNTDLRDWFGYSVAISGDTIVVGAHGEDSNATGVNGNQNDNSAEGAGAAYVFARDNLGNWQQEAYLKASNTEGSNNDDLFFKGDSFGVSVAISGDTIVVGAPYEDSNATGVNGNQNDNSAENAGAAYVFARDSQGNWQQQAYLKASNTDGLIGSYYVGDLFGDTVAISGDTIVVGAPGEDSNATGVDGDQSDNSAYGAGAVYVFVRNSQNGWQQQAYLKASNTDAEDEFGSSVAISDDTIVVGAPFEDSNATGVDGDQSDNSAYDAGAAYVFVRNSQGVWQQQAYLKASNTDAEDSFGYHQIAISGDTIVVGAPWEDSNATGVNGNQNDNSAPDAGAAYVFARDSQGIWQQQAYLKASNTDAKDGFGISVAISGDTIVVGAQREDSNATGVNGEQRSNLAESAGAAYAFARDSQGNWQQEAYLKASNTDAEDSFGVSVAISDDTIVVGAPFEDSNATGVNGDQQDNSAHCAGAAYVFDLNNILTQGDWLIMYYLVGDNDTHMNIGALYNYLANIKNPNIDVAIYWDRRFFGTEYLFKYGTGEKTKETFANLPSDDPQTLINFVTWARSKTNRLNNALVLVDHGNALSGFGWDEGSGPSNRLTHKDLNLAANNLAPIDVLFIEACTMANLETVWELNENVKYFVGHENTVNLIPFSHKYLEQITSTSSPSHVAYMMADSHQRFYSTVNIATTVSVLHVEKLNQLVKDLSQLSHTILNASDTTKSQVWAAMASSDLYRVPISTKKQVVDLQHFVEKIKNISELSNHANQVLESISGFVRFNWQVSSRYTDHQNANGVSVALPVERTSFYSGDLFSFADTANWNPNPRTLEQDLAVFDPDINYWGLFVSTYVLENNPNSEDSPEPPPLLPLETLDVLYLPIIQTVN